MTLPMFKKSVINHLTNKTTWAGMGLAALAVYAFLNGRIEWEMMMGTLSMGLGFIGISDRMD